MNGIDANGGEGFLPLPPEITVLGVGNVLLTDEGFGVRAVECLGQRYDFPATVQLIDGGTLGMELLRFVSGTKRLLVIDSINGGSEPGTIFRLAGDDVAVHFQEKLSAHEVGVHEVLAFLQVTGKAIPEVTVIGAQPYELTAGVRLSPSMAAILPTIADMALAELATWGVAPRKKDFTAALDFTTVAEAMDRKADSDADRGN